MANINIGKTKRSTDDLIQDALGKQQSWLDRRRRFTRAFLGKMNKNEKTKKTTKKTVKKAAKPETKNKSVLRDYWLPILCAIVVVFVAVFVMLVKVNTPVKVVVPPVPEPVVKTVAKQPVSVPTFDIVRIEKNGNLVVAGRCMGETNVSVVINKKVVATEHTNKDGEFVFAPKQRLEPGNYVLSLIDSDKNLKSENSVFLYVSEQGYENSISLLMTKDGSKILQAPALVDGDLVVSKIDYLSNGRLIITGNALPRLRVSLTLNDTYLGFARVSDYKHFGLGADVGELKSGESYKINVRLHDGEGTTIANIEHNFVMPMMTGDDDTFYTVRRGDCLWIIARNFLRRGALFTMIADRNAIKNPDLIFPKQKLQIPVK